MILGAFDMDGSRGRWGDAAGTARNRPAIVSTGRGRSKGEDPTGRHGDILEGHEQGVRWRDVHGQNPTPGRPVRANGYPSHAVR